MAYSYQGREPQPLPFRIYINGTTRTDPTTFTEEELILAGFIQVADRPLEQEGKVITWDIGTFSWIIRDKTQEELDVEFKALVPLSVSKFQAKAALYQNGLLPTVETIMADPATPVLTKLAWSDARDFERNSPTIAALAGILGLTERQLDELFILAGSITA